MIRIITFLVLVFITGQLYAQKPVINSREISGTVIDSTGDAVIGAIVVLTTGTDSVKRSTDIRGFFEFKNTTMAQFTISVRSIGYINYNKRFFYNDANSKIILDPIVLKESSYLLNTVMINGTPAIIYKEDTVEYRASDYIVKPNASAEDLIKKLEGVEVANDGTITHQGITVTRAKLNGRSLGGADLANALQNLPADIIEKMQMVDDYGDQAARTGIKDGDPDRILNIVTRADRSVGNRLQAAAGLGTNERYNTRLNITRLNGNQQVLVRGNINNTVLGVAANNNQGSDFSSGKPNGNAGGGGQANTGIPGSNQNGSGGLSTAGGTTISYADKWNKKLDFNGSYSFNGNNTNTLINSLTTQSSQKFNGDIFIKNDGTTEKDNFSHRLSGQLKYELDSANFLQFSPSLSFASSGNSNFSTINQTGAILQSRVNETGTKNQAPGYAFTTLYSHNFLKKGRVFSAQFVLNSTFNERDRTTENAYQFYDPVSGNFLKDSIANLLINTGNNSKNYRSSITFSEPITATSRIEFNGQVNKRIYDNSQITENFINGEFQRSESLSKIFNYSFAEQRYALNYRYLKGKYNVSLGLTAVPAVLSGFSETLNTSTQRSSFNIIPIARAEYKWSRQKRFNINYTGSPQEPTFDQIQDVPDVSNPQNIIYGNPDLKAQFRHSISTSFNNYLPNSKLNFSVNAQASLTENKVIRNTVELDQSRGSRATYFVNSDGDYSAGGNYNLSKPFLNRKYQVALNGTLNFTNSVSRLNSLVNISKVMFINQRLGIQLYPTKWFELSPNIRYSYLKSNFSLTDNDSQTKTRALSVEGRVDFLEGFFLEYNFSKNYVSGINANVSNNPFIINSSLSKDFFKKKGTIQLQAFDVLNQNNFIIRSIGDNSFTDVKSNALSRYFMLNFTMRLQKWSGAPGKGGKQMKRRGDGNFID
ncbi:outer membrane beta-barrel protein [Daejeonella oryzae]|uniref:outer membrane beta-barrel protein n=1 Tax=Daejeonella oryzae TaxID=1122943 RepID=UPI00041A3B02|nr:outer membrane beta-barrel protein [Daejeonella oryzae]